jgi:hypothetical protein
MDSLLYLLVFACLGLVGLWYVGNEALGARGGWGFLAIRDRDEGESGESAGERRFRLRDGVVPDASGTQSALARAAAAEKAGAPARFREKAPRGFRDRDEARYRSRGPLPRFGDKPDR